MESLSTEVERLADELKRLTAREATILDGLPIGVFRVDREGRILKLNRAASATAGRQEKELIGLLSGEVLSCVNAFFGEGCGRGQACKSCKVRSAITQAFDTGEGVYRGEGEMAINVGETTTNLHFLVTTALLPGTNEHAEEVVVSLEDTTQLMSAKKELLELTKSLERLRRAPPK